MNIRTKIELATAAVVLALILGAVIYWHKAEVDNAVAQAKADAKQQVIDKLQQGIDSRDKQWEQERADFQRQIDSVKTVAQARPIIQPIISSPIPAQQVTKQELPESVQQKLPDSPSQTYNLLTDAQMIQLSKFKLQCDAAMAEVQTCQQDLADTRDKFKQAQGQATDWKKAARKSWIRRYSGDIIKLAIAGLVGYAIHAKK